jgi:hypothetical protein
MRHKEARLCGLCDPPLVSRRNRRDDGKHPRLELLHVAFLRTFRRAVIASSAQASEGATFTSSLFSLVVFKQWLRVRTKSSGAVEHEAMSSR